MKGAKVFLNIDLRSGYHQVHIKGENIYKTALSTRYRHYEFVVVFFGHTNAPSTFMCLWSVLHPYLDKFVIVFIDDKLIYSKNEEEHLEHLATMLIFLREHQLYSNLSKWNLFQTKVITWDTLFAWKVLQWTQKRSELSWTRELLEMWMKLDHSWD